MMSQSSTITEPNGEAASVTSARCHPGEVLREELVRPLSLNANKLALALRVPAGRIRAILNEKRAISPDIALRLARFFGTSPEFWLNLQSNYDLRLAKANAGIEIDRDIKPLQFIMCVTRGVNCEELPVTAFAFTAKTQPHP
jgi:antitoxin HigA-1